MLTPDVRFEGWTADDWMRFLHLWKPRATSERELTRPRGGVIAIHDGRRVRKLLHTVTGRIEAPRTPWPIPLSELAQVYGASWSSRRMRGRSTKSWSASGRARGGGKI